VAEKRGEVQDMNLMRRIACPLGFLVDYMIILVNVRANSSTVFLLAFTSSLTNLLAYTQLPGVIAVRPLTLTPRTVLLD
jgi:hypothetical protein